ncbi:MAG: hypothetical protein ABJN40_20915 [Sneathiella sp.]
MSKKWLMTSGAVGLIAVGLAAGAYFVNTTFQTSFQKAIADLGAGATGKKISFETADLNIFTGSGSITGLKVESGSKDPDIFVLETIAVDFIPWSLLLGPIKVEQLKIGKITANVTISATSVGAAAAVVAAAGQFLKKPNPDYVDIHILLQKIEQGSGVVNVTFKLPGRSYNRRLSFAGYDKSFDDKSEDAVTPVEIASRFVKTIAQSAITAAKKG